MFALVGWAARTLRSGSCPDRGRRRTGMGVGDGTAAELTAELRRLYEAAGRPPRKSLVHWGSYQEPQVSLNEKTLSDWLSPRVVSVPSNERTLLRLVAHLEQAAVKKGYQRRSPGWWMR